MLQKSTLNDVQDEEFEDVVEENTRAEVIRELEEAAESLMAVQEQHCGSWHPILRQIWACRLMGNRLGCFIERLCVLR